MRRISLFLILTIASLASLVVIVIVGYYALSSTYPYPGSWIGQMESMMESGLGGSQAQTQTSLAPYFGLVFVILVGVAVVGVGGLVYFIVLPEIKITKHPSAQSVNSNGEKLVSRENIPEAPSTPYDAVLRTLSRDERKVVEVLNSHEGKYLQKYIRNETGLSRLQTHRIIAHLSQMGIVSTEKTGNTNIVLLEKWLK